jgi:hypothetical protein
MAAGLKRLREKASFQAKGPKSISQGLKRLREKAILTVAD